MCDGERTKILQDSLDSFKEEHRELSDTWRHIETKAQGTAAIAGIFVASVFAFIRFLSEDSAQIEKVLLVFALFFLGLSILFSIAALWVREVTAAPVGDTLHKLVSDLLDAGKAKTAENLDKLVRDQVSIWSDVNEEIHNTNHGKARHLFREIGRASCRERV